MADWTGGYVADLGYTYGYYGELNPLAAQLLLLAAGLACPKIEAACELGFGQGVGINIHAAGTQLQWYGADFNPAQAAHAQGLADASGAALYLSDESFEQFATRQDLPGFDFIGLHGIWSWVSDQNRQTIVRLIEQRLNPGGVVYVSYNTQPGWAAMLPLREWMTRYVQTELPGGQALPERIDQALSFVDRLLGSEPRFLAANPGMAERIGALRQLSRSYLAHEYFNRDWHPMTFATMAESLGEAKLNFACSAFALDNVDAIHLTAQQSAILQEIRDDVLRQTTRDFMVNQQFRRDYWVKGARRLNLEQQTRQLDGLRVVLVQPARNIQLTVKGALGEASLQEEVYRPILTLLSDHRPHYVRELRQLPNGGGFATGVLLQALVVLAGKGALAVAQEDEAIEQAQASSQRLNQHLMVQARGSSDIQFLSSPVTGGGIPVGRLQQLFAAAMSASISDTEGLANYVWEIFAAQGAKVNRDGQPLESVEDNQAELRRLARIFQDEQWPLLQALRIV